MNSKRPSSDNPQNRASVINMLTSEVFPIEKDKECIFGRCLEATIIIDEKYMSRLHCSIRYESEGDRYVISDLNSCGGTYLNRIMIPSGKNNVTQLEQEDIISFCNRERITLSYQFILHALPAKKLRSDYEREILEARKEAEMHKNTVLEQQLEIESLKSELKDLRNTEKGELAEMQDIMEKAMGITNTQMFKAKEIVQRMANQITIYKSDDGNLNEHMASEVTKNQIYAQLKNYFQCSICLDLTCKATTIRCSHTFCHVCIRTWRNNGNLKCPICRAPYNRDTNCTALDSFITTFCDLMGGSVKEQRQKVLTEKSVVVPIACVRRDNNTGNHSRRIEDIDLTVDTEDEVIIPMAYLQRTMARMESINRDTV